MKKIAISILLFLFSCSSIKKSERLFDKAMRIDKATTLKRVSQYSKVETKYVRDTIRFNQYIIERNQIINQIDSTIKNIDTIISSTYEIDVLKEKLKQSYQFIDGLQEAMQGIPILVDTVYQTDENKMIVCQKNNDVLNFKLVDEKQKRIRDLTGFLILLILMSGALSFFIYKSKSII